MVGKTQPSPNVVRIEEKIDLEEPPVFRMHATWIRCQYQEWFFLLRSTTHWHASNQKNSTSCMDDHHCTNDDFETVGALADTCAQIVLTCCYCARLSRPDILWTFARAVTIWNRSFAKGWRDWQVISNALRVIDHFVMLETKLTDLKSRSGGRLCMFGDHTFVPIS